MIQFIPKIQSLKFQHRNNKILNRLKIDSLKLYSPKFSTVINFAFTFNKLFLAKKIIYHLSFIIHNYPLSAKLSKEVIPPST